MTQVGQVKSSSSAKKFVIYHNPRCSKSREALDILKKAGINPKVVEYLKTPIPVGDLERLLKQMKMNPENIVREDEERYVDLELATDPPKSRKAWIKLLSDNPVLIQRPIVTDGTRAVLARPPQAVEKLFTS